MQVIAPEVRAPVNSAVILKNDKHEIYYESRIFPATFPNGIAQTITVSLPHPVIHWHGGQGSRAQGPDGDESHQEQSGCRPYDWRQMGNVYQR